MSKRSPISLDLKIQAVTGYLSGQLSQEASADKYGVSDMTIRNWLRKYKVKGAAGLQPISKPQRYPPELKRAAVEAYLSGAGSLSKLCEKYDISDPCLLRGWIKWYNCHGGFKQPNKEMKSVMTKPRKTTQDERVEIVIHCIGSNKDYGKTIEKYGVSYGQLLNWIKKYEKYGPDGLIDRRGRRKEESELTELEKLQVQLKRKEAENLQLQMELDLLKKLKELEGGWAQD
jgi:transposase-like protein